VCEVGSGGLLIGQLEWRPACDVLEVTSDVRCRRTFCDAGWQNSLKQLLVSCGHCRKRYGSGDVDRFTMLNAGTAPNYHCCLKTC